MGTQKPTAMERICGHPQETQEQTRIRGAPPDEFHVVQGKLHSIAGRYYELVSHHIAFYNGCPFCLRRGFCLVAWLATAFGDLWTAPHAKGENDDCC